MPKLLVPTLKVVVEICQKCKHQWVRKGEQSPKVCPKCKRYDWQEPRK